MTEVGTGVEHAVLAGIGEDCAKYPEYIGDCLFQDFDWLVASVSASRMNQLETGDASKINSLLGASMLRIKIGDGVYILQVDGSNTKKANTPCNMSSPKLYKYRFVESSLPDQSEYREDDEEID